MVTAAEATTGSERPATLRPPASSTVVCSLVRLHELLANARVVWLSSTRPDGRPHVVPTWFDWDGEVITIFTHSDAQKVRNVRHDPRVMLAIGHADQTFEVELMEADAQVLDGTVTGTRAPRPSPRFAAKYADALRETGRTFEAFVEDYPSVLRIRPTRLLDWGARGLAPR